MRQPQHKLLALLAVLSLTACGGQHDELQAWMDQQRQEVKPNVQPLTEPRKFHPQAYAGMESEEPFSQNKLTGALKNEATQPNSAVSAELNRRKEPLEAFPLDAMTMVGSLDRGGKRVALLRVDKLLYQVRVGEHLGQNYGRVTKITEGDVVLREIVQDAAGEWIERNSELQLQEKKR